MITDELRSVFPTRMVRGAMLRPDGRALGIVGGGAPQWELLPPAERAARAAAYHQALLALDRPLHVYSMDYSLNVGIQIEYLLERQERAESPLQVAILGEMADRLADAAPAGALRAKQVVWAVAVGATGGSALPNLRRPDGRREAGRGDDALSEAVECARRLVDSLTAVGGFPAPRLLEPEEMAQLVYRQADPVRAQRYPLHDTLLARIQRVVVAEASR